MTEKFPCPKCRRPLAPSGEIAVDGSVCPVYQCDECLIAVKMFGQQVEVALTFAVGPDGKPFDSAAENGSLPG